MFIIHVVVRISRNLKATTLPFRGVACRNVVNFFGMQNIEDMVKLSFCLKPLIERGSPHSAGISRRLSQPSDNRQI